MQWNHLKNELKIKLQNFFHGRYGVDQLTTLILVISLILSIMSNRMYVPWLQFFAYLGVVLALYRTFSRSFGRRRLENQFLLGKLQAISSWFKVQKQIALELKTHRHFKCPKCKQRLRVPRGRGKIRVICSKCKEEFSRRS